MSSTPVTLADLTTAALDGPGVFDVLMRAAKGHIEEEFRANRIKGPEYAQVYLGTLQAVLQTAASFVLGKEKSAAEIAEIEARTALIEQQTINAVQELANLKAQECELKAQFDLLVENKLKTAEEKTLLIWKTTTEKAQTIEVGVDANSVIGKQKALYGAQADGFQRDAEQKVAKILVDSWNVRRTTDEGTVADATNKLDDATVGRTVAALLAGIGA